MRLSTSSTPSNIIAPRIVRPSVRTRANSRVSFKRRAAGKRKRGEAITAPSLARLPARHGIFTKPALETSAPRALYLAMSLARIAVAASSTLEHHAATYPARGASMSSSSSGTECGPTSSRPRTLPPCTRSPSDGVVFREQSRRLSQLHQRQRRGARDRRLSGAERHHLQPGIPRRRSTR